MSRKILVLAHDKPVEALRVAAGLTLADIELQVLSLGALPVGPEVDVQLEALAFADVTPRALPADAPSTWDEIARAILAHDTVYML
ncbi:MAG: hypothetical protein AMXMBFR66_32490 [Pseudomonadota bacterium]|nr:hypothetical protein [Rubrivivax sp.]NLZ40973.1 hypothetical protein [Comamonadaceae bacterium]